MPVDPKIEAALLKLVAKITLAEIFDYSRPEIDDFISYLDQIINAIDDPSESIRQVRNALVLARADKATRNSE